MTRPIVAGVALLVGLTASTQWFAHRLDYHPSLGGALRLGHIHIYWPWSFLTWWRHSDSRAYGESLVILAVIVVGSGLTSLLLQPRSVRSFGDERWGTLADARRAGLLTGKGLPLGYLKGQTVSYAGDGGLLSIAAARAGKTRGDVLAAILSTPKSCVNNDPKGELYEKSAGHRSLVSRVLALDPTREETACWNPLDEIRKTHDIRDAQRIAHALIDFESTSEKIWPTRAAELDTALILHVLHAEPEKDLGRVRELLQDLEGTIPQMLTTPHIVGPDGESQVHPEVRRVALDLTQQHEKFRESVRATALAALTLWADPAVVRATSKSTFAIADLVCGDEPVTLYLESSPAEAMRLRPFQKLFVEMLFTRLLERLDRVGDRPKKHELLFMADEATLLAGHGWEGYAAYLRLAAGYGVQCYTVSQAFADLGVFGRHQSIPDTVAVTSVFGVSDTDTLNRVSAAVGPATEYRRSYSREARLSLFPKSLSDSEQTRPAIDTGQVRALSPDEKILLVNGVMPLLVKKINVYAERAYKKRLLPPPPYEEAVGEEIESVWRDERPKGPPLPLPEKSAAPAPKPLYPDDAGLADDEPRIEFDDLAFPEAI